MNSPEQHRETGSIRRQVIEDFGKAPVLVIGDVMLDQYVWGEVVRISPEAPVPILRVRERSEGAGGAGNVAANLAGLGSPVTLIGIIGPDGAGTRLGEILERLGVRCRFISAPSQCTITKTRIMAQNQQLFRIDEEVASLPPQASRTGLMALINSLLPDFRAVVLSDYGKGVFLDPDVSQLAIQLARKHGIPALVDPKAKDWSRYRGATCVTPNADEFQAISGRLDDGRESSLIQAANHTRETYELEWLLVTRGRLGMCLVGGDGPPSLVPARAREVFDVSGAGDTVIAALGAALAAGLPMPEAARIANIAAGIVVGKLGTQPIMRHELEAAMRAGINGSVDPTACKIAGRDGAQTQVKAWRSSGFKVVFTNGCFDMLHPGHIHLLHEARALGDRLVVGMNSDSSVRRLKGEGRPILSESDRACLVAALSCVDLVVLFDEDTPLSLIGFLQPDVLVKGSDYQIHEVVGKDVVESYGGRVALVPVLEGHSTTALITRVSNELNPVSGK